MVRRRFSRPEPYDPNDYWERRAPELIDAYQHPETWEARGWMIGRSPEAIVVPELLERHEVRSVLVAGAGSGRQYEYLDTSMFEVHGFDLSPTMVAECRTRFPNIETTVANVIGCEANQQPADAVLAVTVLQHVAPGDIATAVRSLRSLARKLLIVLELTHWDGQSTYVFPHDYESLMSGWRLVARQAVRDEEHERTELLAWTPDSGSARQER